jgi:hypothetical protein
MKPLLSRELSLKAPSSKLSSSKPALPKPSSSKPCGAEIGLRALITRLCNLEAGDSNSSLPNSTDSKAGS